MCKIPFQKTMHNAFHPLKRRKEGKKGKEGREGRKQALNKILVVFTKGTFSYSCTVKGYELLKGYKDTINHKLD